MRRERYFTGMFSGRWRRGSYESLRSRTSIDWLEPKNLLQEIKVPIFLSHGRDDVVVPYPQINTLREWVPKERCHGVYITGFHHHTGIEFSTNTPNDIHIAQGGDSIDSDGSCNRRTGGILK